MKTVTRTQHIMKLKLKIIHLKTEKISLEEIVLPSWYTSEKIMLTKLDEILSSKGWKLIEIISADKMIRNYSQSLEYFKSNAETITDEIHKTF